MKLLKFSIFICLSIFTIGCDSISVDKDAGLDLKGRWYIDNNWYDFKSDTSYAAGVGEMQFFDNLVYFHNKETKQLTMYTNTEDDTYYFNYTQPHKDTLILTSIVNPEGGSIQMVQRAVKKQ